MSFVHKVPGELQQEDRWFKIFSPKQAVIAVVLGIIALMSGSVINKAIGFIPTILVEIPFVIISGVFMFFKIPKEKYLLGGGQYMIMIMFRCIVRLCNQTLYVKHYDEPENGGK